MTPAPLHGDRATRAVRGVLAASLAALVALAGHLLGGGSTPAPVVVLAAVVLAWPAAVVLAGARPRLWRQALTIAVGQLLLHAVFALGTGATAVGGGGGSGTGMAGMGGMPEMGGMPGMASAAPAAGALHLPDAAMWLGHGLAWLLTVAAWRWGEQVVARLAELGAGALARVVLLLAPLQPPPLPRAVRSRTDRVAARLLDTVLLRHPRRGPPVPA